MPSTRASTKAAPSVSATSSSTITTIKPRALRELQIDGTKALGGDLLPPRKPSGAVYKSRGGYWQDVESQTPKKSTKRKRVAATAPGEPAAKKSRQSSHEHQAAPRPSNARTASQKRKRPADDDDDDIIFLRAAQSQLKRVKTADAKRIRPYLAHLRQPREHEAHMLSKAEARRLLAGSIHIDRPIFVAGGANTANIIDPDDERRPIEQFFTWLGNPDEEFELPSPTRSARDDKAPGTITAAALRERFEAHNGPVGDGEPYNFPDIAIPFPVSGAPDFTLSPACNLLRDLCRYLLDCGPSNICQDGCPERPKGTLLKCCQRHFLTTTEYAELQLGWRLWQGTVMLAEAGALSQPHVDKWGLGTHISCVEGEIGFAWLDHPTDDELRGLLEMSDETATSGRWLYKVLRPGQALYMPPGTPHLVFRLPGGKQTLGLAGHLVRRCDVERWVGLLEMEVKQEAATDQVDEAFAAIVRGLAEGIEYHLQQVERPAEAYGGFQALQRARAALDRILEQL